MPCSFDGRRHGPGKPRRFRLSGAGHRAPQEPGQCPGQDPGRLLGLHRGLFRARLWRGLRHALFRGRRAAGGTQRLWPGQVLLSADLRRRHSRHHLGRHCRTRQVLAPADRHGHDRGPDLPLLRGHCLEPAFRRAGLDQGTDRRRVPRLCRQRGRSRRGGWIALGAVLLLACAAIATARAERLPPHRPPAFPSWRWAPGF